MMQDPQMTPAPASAKTPSSYALAFICFVLGGTLDISGGTILLLLLNQAGGPDLDSLAIFAAACLIGGILLVCAFILLGGPASKYYQSRGTVQPTP